MKETIAFVARIAWHSIVRQSVVQCSNVKSGKTCLRTHTLSAWTMFDDTITEAECRTMNSLEHLVVSSREKMVVVEGRESLFHIRRMHKNHILPNQERTLLLDHRLCMRQEAVEAKSQQGAFRTLAKTEVACPCDYLMQSAAANLLSYGNKPSKASAQPAPNSNQFWLSTDTAQAASHVAHFKHYHAHRTLISRPSFTPPPFRHPRIDTPRVPQYSMNAHVRDSVVHSGKRH